MVSSVFRVACTLLVLACEIWFPGQGLIPDPLHWEHGVLAIGPPGKSQFVCLFVFRIKQGEHVLVEKKKGSKLGKGISYEDWGTDLIGDREVQPAGQKRSLLVCPAWDWLGTGYWQAKSKVLDRKRACRGKLTPVHTERLWLPMQAGGALQGTDFPTERAAGPLSARPEGGCRITTCAGPVAGEELHWVSLWLYHWPQPLLLQCPLLNFNCTHCKGEMHKGILSILTKQEEWIESWETDYILL